MDTADTTEADNISYRTPELDGILEGTASLVVGQEMTPRQLSARLDIRRLLANRLLLFAAYESLVDTQSIELVNRYSLLNVIRARSSSKNDRVDETLCCRGEE
jgi:hypothetical protein